MAAFEAKYPLRDMTDVGDWFFLPGVTKDMTRYFTKRGVALGMRFTIEKCKDPLARYGDLDGIKVTRVA